MLSRKLHILTLGTAVLIMWSGLSRAAEAVQIGINASFDHSTQNGFYQTHLSLAGPWKFSDAELGLREARFTPDREGCFSIVSWYAEFEQVQPVGPAVICLSSASVTVEDFNKWLTSKNRHVTEPTLVIPLKQINDVSLQGQDNTEWTNEQSIDARAFVKACGSDSFIPYGTINVPSDSLLFVLQRDVTGDLQADVSAGQLTLDPDPNAWDLVRETCDVDQVLPAETGIGFSLEFKGTSESPPPTPGTLAATIEPLFDQIDALVFQGQISQGLGRTLRTTLERSISVLQSARPDRAARLLAKFQRQVGKAASKRLIDAEAAQAIIDQALAGEIYIDGFPLQKPFEPDPTRHCSPGQSCPDTFEDCQLTLLYVDASGAVPEPDGSPEQPFATIGKALAAADAQGVCGAELRIAPGVYDEDVSVNRHTILQGDPDPGADPAFVGIRGTISNTGPFVLEIHDLILFWDNDTPADGVFVDHPCASVRISNVAILDYRGFGIRQRGGSLTLDAIQVARTRSTEASLVHGTGILLSCGVRARMSSVALLRNQTSGLFLAGEGTEVTVLGLEAQRTQVHPAFADPAAGLTWGAVHVRDRAHLDMEGFYLDRNLGVGVSVEELGTASLQWGRVSNTVWLDRIEGAPGFGAVAKGHGHLVMRHVTVTRADLCGVVVGQEGAIDMYGMAVGHLPRVRSTAEISFNPVGACVHVPGYDVIRLANGVLYHDNGTSFEASDFAIPAAGEPGGL